MLELYHAHISTCSQKVRLCLSEKNLDWTSNVINFAASEHLSDDYMKLNPNGVVPTLVHEGRAIIDSSVICEYLEEAFPDAGASLMPDESYGRARMRAWLRYIEEVPTTAIRYPSFNRLFAGFLAARSEEERQAHINRTPLRKELYQKFGTSGFSEDEVNASRERLRQTLERMETALSEGPWLLGAQYTIADICVIPTIVRMEDIGLKGMWDDLPKFESWYEAAQKRPSFANAYYDGARVALGDEKVLSR